MSSKPNDELETKDELQALETSPEVSSQAAEPGEGDLQNRIIDEYKKEKDELYDRLLRKQAEFENYRKRIEKERTEIADVVRAAVIREFLPVLDACERASKSLAELDPTTPGVDAYRSGSELIHRKFLETLAKFKVVPIPSVGQPFDPNLHHAIMREETNEVPENWILEELLKGYTYGDRLLRPAQVKVAVLKSDGKLDSEG